VCVIDWKLIRSVFWKEKPWYFGIYGPAVCFIPMKNPTVWTQLIIIFFCRPMPRWHGSFSQFMSFFLLAFKNASHFGAPKYPKRSVNPAMSLLHNAPRIKKTSVTLFCVHIFFKIFKSSLWTQNHCVSGLFVLIYLTCNCFFDLPGSWDWRRSSLKAVVFQSRHSMMPKLILKRYVHTVGWRIEMSAPIRFSWCRPVQLGKIG